MATNLKKNELDTDLPAEPQEESQAIQEQETLESRIEQAAAQVDREIEEISKDYIRENGEAQKKMRSVIGEFVMKRPLWNRTATLDGLKRHLDIKLLGKSRIIGLESEEESEIENRLSEPNMDSDQLEKIYAEEMGKKQEEIDRKERNISSNKSRAELASGGKRGSGNREGIAKLIESEEKKIKQLEKEHQEAEKGANSAATKLAEAIKNGQESDRIQNLEREVEEKKAKTGTLGEELARKKEEIEKMKRTTHDLDGIKADAISAIKDLEEEKETLLKAKKSAERKRGKVAEVAQNLRKKRQGADPREALMETRFYFLRQKKEKEMIEEEATKVGRDPVEFMKDPEQRKKIEKGFADRHQESLQKEALQGAIVDLSGLEQESMEKPWWLPRMLRYLKGTGVVVKFLADKKSAAWFGETLKERGKDQIRRLLKIDMRNQGEVDKWMEEVSGLFPAEGRSEKLKSWLAEFMASLEKSANGKGWTEGIRASGLEEIGQFKACLRLAYQKRISKELKNDIRRVMPKIEEFEKAVAEARVSADPGLAKEMNDFARQGGTWYWTILNFLGAQGKDKGGKLAVGAKNISVSVLKKGWELAKKHPKKAIGLGILVPLSPLLAAAGVCAYGIYKGYRQFKPL